MTTKTTEAFTQKAANRQQKKPLSFMLQPAETTQRIWQQKGWTGFIDQKESSEYKCFNVEPFVILSISQGQLLSTKIPPSQALQDRTFHLITLS